MTGTVKVRLADLDAAERRLLREIRRAWDTVLSLSMRRERYECQPRPDDAALWLARIDETFRAQRLVEGELSELERRRDRIRAEIARLSPPPARPRSTARVIVHALPAPQLSLLSPIP